MVRSYVRDDEPRLQARTCKISSLFCRAITLSRPLKHTYQKNTYQMSRVTKIADQMCINFTADQRLCFHFDCTTDLFCDCSVYATYVGPRLVGNPEVMVLCDVAQKKISAFEPTKCTCIFK